MIFKIMRGSRGEVPCATAQVRYGEWHECRRRAFVETNVVGGKSRIPTNAWYESRIPTNAWYELCDSIIETPDSDVKRNARLEGDYVVWEQRDKWFEVEVNDLAELLDVIGSDGMLFCDGGKCHIQVFDD